MIDTMQHTSIQKILILTFSILILVYFHIHQEKPSPAKSSTRIETSKSQKPENLSQTVEKIHENTDNDEKLWQTKKFQEQIDRRKNYLHQCQNFLKAELTEFTYRNSESYTSLNKLKNYQSTLDKLHEITAPGYSTWQQIFEGEKRSNLVNRTWTVAPFAGRMKYLFNNYETENSQQNTISVCSSPKSGSTSWGEVLRATFNNLTVAEQMRIDETDFKLGTLLISHDNFRIGKMLNFDQLQKDALRNVKKSILYRSKEHKNQQHYEFWKNQNKNMKHYQPEFISELYFDAGNGQEKIQNYKNLMQLAENSQKLAESVTIGKFSNLKNFRILHGRHPFLRLRSAFTDKFCSPIQEEEANKTNPNTGHRLPSYNKNFAKYHQQAKFYETETSFESFEKLDREFLEKTKKKCQVSFYAFLKFLIDGEGLKNYANQHWEPMYYLCGTCFVDFNLFTKLEFIDEDIEYLENNVLRAFYEILAL